jgi:hypothetical protein
METEEFVVAYLHTPRERWWGILRAVSPAGITIRGVPLESFEPWARAIARGDSGDLQPSTVFFPLTRVERIYSDESSVSVPSHADRFREWTGEDARFHLIAPGSRPQ